LADFAGPLFFFAASAGFGGVKFYPNQTKFLFIPSPSFFSSFSCSASSLWAYFRRWCCGASESI